MLGGLGVGVGGMYPILLRSMRDFIGGCVRYFW